jgi:hypothetical protein
VHFVNGKKRKRNVFETHLHRLCAWKSDPPSCLVERFRCDENLWFNRKRCCEQFETCSASDDEIDVMKGERMSQGERDYKRITNTKSTMREKLGNGDHDARHR